MARMPAPDRVQDLQTHWGVAHLCSWGSGSNKPGVLFVPGRAAGIPMWRENLERLMGAREIYAVDPIGDVGLSVQQQPLVRFEDQAGWLSQLVRKLPCERVHVVGHSFGGASAAIFALLHPEQVVSLTLLEPVAVVAPIPLWAMGWATCLLLPVPNRIRQLAMARIGGVDPDELRRGKDPLSETIDLGSRYFQTRLPLPRTFTGKEWSSMKVPTRVDVAGTRSLTGGEKAIERMRRFSRIRCHLWPNATHSLPMQESEALAVALRKFWNLIDS